MDKARSESRASLFDEEERRRVVDAYAAKLATSREEMVQKILDQQALERTKCLDELKTDVAAIMQDVVEAVRSDLAESRRA